MLCEQYRDGLMALLDGELESSEQDQVQDHLHRCPICNSEYQSFEKLNHLAHKMCFRCPDGFAWQNYWHGVCRKMDTNVRWSSWVGGSCVLIGAGSLMSYGFKDNPMATVLGGTAVAMGAGMLWLSYYCNCSGERK